MDSLTAPTCLRCAGFMPTNDTPGLYPGAISRYDNRTEICSACGSDEALRQHMAHEMVPAHEWPVGDPHKYRNLIHGQAGIS